MDLGMILAIPLGGIIIRRLASPPSQTMRGLQEIDDEMDCNWTGVDFGSSSPAASSAVFRAATGQKAGKSVEYNGGSDMAAYRTLERHYAYDRNDKWFKRLKQLEDNHRRRVNRSPKQQLKALHEDLCQWFDPKLLERHREQERQRRELEAIKARGFEHKYRRHQLRQDRWFQLKFSLLRLFTGQSSFTVLREMLREG